MAGTFIISGLNSFDWFLQYPVLNEQYNTLPSEVNRLSYNPYGVYAQKWQTNDTPPTQLLSDFTPTFNFYKCKLNQLYRNIDMPIVANSIIGVSFKSYQAYVDFSTFDVDLYYATITYMDDDSNEITWRTSPIDLRVKHPKTLLFQYKNTFNTQNILFQTPNDIELLFRVEGMLVYVDPDSDTEVYTDQEHNVTQESSVPFFTDILYIGPPQGVPEWVIKKLNLIFTLDQKKIDGFYYEKVESGSKFTIYTRQENAKNTDATWQLPVIKNEDFFLDGYNVGDNPDDNDLQVIVRTKEYLLNGGNITFSGVLKKASTLAFIQITNRDLDSFNILVGTTNGGVEIGRYPTTGNINDFFAIGRGFNIPTTIYITGISGHDLDIWVGYYQLDDRTTIPVSGSGGFVKGTVYIYEEISPGDFENDFDIATGLGQTGSKYEGCALSGTNGTIDRSHMAAIGWDRLLPSTRDTSIGPPNNLITINRANLPAEGLNIPDLSVNTSYRTGGNTQHAAANDPSAPRAKTENMGSGNPIDITNFSLYTTFFVKIVD